PSTPNISGLMPDSARTVRHKPRNVRRAGRLHATSRAIPTTAEAERHEQQDRQEFHGLPPRVGYTDVTMLGTMRATVVTGLSFSRKRIVLRARSVRAVCAGRWHTSDHDYVSRVSLGGAIGFVSFGGDLVGGDLLVTARLSFPHSSPRGGIEDTGNLGSNKWDGRCIWTRGLLDGILIH